MQYPKEVFTARESQTRLNMKAYEAQEEQIKRLRAEMFPDYLELTGRQQIEAHDMARCKIWGWTYRKNEHTPISKGA